MSDYVITTNGELYHYGIPGMKWGHRKAQIQPTGMGRMRSSYRQQTQSAKKAYKAQQQQARNSYKQEKNAYKQTHEYKAARAAKVKKAAKIGAAAAGTALAVYGAYKLNNYVKTKNCQIAADRGYKSAQRLFEQQSKSIQSQIKNSSDVLGGRTTVAAGQRAINSARNASNDNFRTAARNVVNYKRSGGNLKSLKRVGSYDPNDIFEAAFKKKR